MGSNSPGRACNGLRRTSSIAAVQSLPQRAFGLLQAPFCSSCAIAAVLAPGLDPETLGSNAVGGLLWHFCDVRGRPRSTAVLRGKANLRRPPPPALSARQNSSRQDDPDPFRKPRAGRRRWPDAARCGRASLDVVSASAAFAGFTRTATRVVAGTISLRSSIRFVR